MSDDAAPKGKFLAAIAWLAKRRHDSSFTLAQAEALSMEEFSELMGDVTAPKVKPSKPAPKTSRSS
jgi:hypothetical protein